MRALALVVLLAPGLARADIDEKGVRVGVDTITLTTGSSNPAAPPPQGETHAAPGVVVGAYITQRFTPTFALQFEGLFSIKSSQTELCMSTGGNTDACMNTRDLVLHYFELPVLMRFDLLPGERGKFHLDLGPELAIHLGTTDKAAGNAALDLNPGNFGVVVGAGVEFGAGPGRITVDARYQRWAIPLKDGGELGGKIASSHQLVVTVGYAFP